MTTPELSIIIPCLNEERTIKAVVENAILGAMKTNLTYEIIVSDNGSTDSTLAILRQSPVIIVEASKKGYGAALKRGIEIAQGNYIVMADADDSYELENLDRFVHALQNGSELVVGNRFQGGIDKGAMPFLHRYVGNPVLSLIGRIFFRINIGDFHCGMRAFTRSSALQLKFRSDGMEFASEMIAKYALDNRQISEIATRLRKDGRGRKSHLRTWRDGWRHLKFLLIYSPSWLFLFPAALSSLVGISSSLALLSGEIHIFGKSVNMLGSIIGSILMIFGFQLAFLFILTTKIGHMLQLYPNTQNSLGRAAVVLKPELWLIFLAGTLVCIVLWLSSFFNHWLRDALTSLQAESRLKEGLVIGTLLIISALGVANSFLHELLQKGK